MKLPVPICQFMNTPDEWHAYWFGYFEKCGKPTFTNPPAYVLTEQHYYNMGCAHGRRWRMIGDLIHIVIASFLILAALLMAGHVTTWAAIQLFLGG